MKKTELAKQLRARMHHLAETKGGAFIAAAANADILSDDIVIDSHVTCAKCGYKQASGTALRILIRESSTAEDFLARIAHSSHQGEEERRMAKALADAADQKLKKPGTK